MRGTKTFKFHDFFGFWTYYFMVFAFVTPMFDFLVMQILRKDDPESFVESFCFRLDLNFILGNPRKLS